MCGRFDVDARDPIIKEISKKLPPDGKQVKFGEVFPGNFAMTIKKEGHEPAVRGLSWGFPKTTDKGLIINARAETALQKYLFNRDLKKNPLAIPVSGFYEWRMNEDTGRKDKFLFSLPEKEIFYLAGFGKYFPDSPAGEHCVVLTTEANESMRPYHHRMPVLLKMDEVIPWINGENLHEILKRIPMNLQPEKM